jgi:ADP-heptose:LPS heptosyltransferase
MELRDFVALLQSAALFAGSDTGPMHVAWASGVPTVGVYGPTRADRNGPVGPHTRSVQSPLGCVGCRRRICPDGTDACMRGVTPLRVLELAREVLAVRAEGRPA